MREMAFEGRPGEGGMKGAGRRLVVLALALLSGGAFAFDLVVDGRPKAQLYAPGKAEEAAAKEFQKYIAKMSGATLEIVRKERLLRPRLGVVRFGKTCPDAACDELVVRVAKNGRTMDLTGDGGRGMFFATYRMLETLGVGFWCSTFETVPEKKTLRVENGFELRDRPAFRHRYGQGYCEVYSRDWQLKSGQSLQDRSLGFKNYGLSNGETLGLRYLNPAKYFDEHPDWYAWRAKPAERLGFKKAPSPLADAKDKTRCTGAGPSCRCPKCRNARTRQARAKSQPCLSHPGAREQLLKEVLADLEADPSHQVSLASNDTDELCQCADCEKIAGQYGANSAREAVLANWIATKVRGRYPDVRICILSYWLKQRPFNEKLKLEPEVWVCVAAHYNMSRPARKDKDHCARMRRWGEIAPGRLVTWDYYANFMRFTTACPNLDLMADNLRWYRDLGVVNVTDQMILSNLGHLADVRSYVHAKFMWNPDLDAKKTIDEWFDNVCGPAADLIKKYHWEQCAVRDRKKDLWSGMYNGVGFYKAATGEDLVRWHLCFEQAKELVKDDPERLRMVERMGAAPLVDLFAAKSWCDVDGAARKMGVKLPSYLERCKAYMALARKYGGDEWSERKSFDPVPYLSAAEAEAWRRERAP